MNYISFIVTCGGDAGWRFSNQDEWNSVSGRLLFDSEIWTLKKIENAVNDLWFKYFRDNTGHSLGEKYDIGVKYVIPFINNNEGVYVDESFEGDRFGCKLGFKDTLAKKRIIPSENDVITRWKLNNNTYCEYSKKYDKWCWENKK